MQPLFHCAVTFSFYNFPSSSLPQYQVEWTDSPHPLTVPWLFCDCLAQGNMYCRQPLQFYTSEKETTPADFRATQRKALFTIQRAREKEPTAMSSSTGRGKNRRVRLSFRTISTLLWNALAQKNSTFLDCLLRRQPSSTIKQNNYFFSSPPTFFWSFIYLYPTEFCVYISSKLSWRSC